MSEPPPGRALVPRDGEAVIDALRVVGPVLVARAGIRLADETTETVDALEPHRELSLEPTVCAGLLATLT